MRNYIYGSTDLVVYIAIRKSRYVFALRLRATL